jgi:hypothetical protein
MKTRFLFSMLAVLTYVSVSAQVSITAQSIAGGTDNDYLIKLCKTNQGGLLAAGYSASNQSGYKSQNSRGSYDYWVVRYSSTRKKLWDKTIGGDASDVLIDAISTSDGGFLLGGNSMSGKSGEKTGNSHGSLDYWLVKLDGQGNIQWDKTIGGTEYDVLSDIDETSDGGYILAGSLGLTKIDSKGTVQWQKKLSYLDPRSIRPTKDGGYILTGTYDPGTGFSFYMVKADNNFNKQWSYNFGWSYANVSTFDAQQTSDGGFIGYGYGPTSRDEADDYYYDYVIRIAKTDNNGNVQWNPSSNNDPLYSATPAAIEGDFSMVQTSDGGFLFATSYKDYYLLKFSSTGNLQWTQWIGGDNDDVLMDIRRLAPNQYMLAGYSSSGISRDKTKRNLGGADYWLVAVTDASTAITTTSVTAASTAKRETKEMFVYPNPAKNILHIQTNSNAMLILTDQSGKILFAKTVNGKGEINVANFAAGLYYLKNTTTGEVQKVIVNK